MCSTTVQCSRSRQRDARAHRSDHHLERPLERYLFLPKRHNDVFAQFAETMWMLAGRDDIVGCQDICREPQTIPMMGRLGTALWSAPSSLGVAMSINSTTSDDC